jgi:hypothetical protein
VTRNDDDDDDDNNNNNNTNHKLYISTLLAEEWETSDIYIT